METWQQAWQTLRSELTLHSGRLIAELEAAWRDVDDLLRGVEETYANLADQKIDLISQDSASAGFEKPAKDLCLTPVQRYLDRRPALRALRAIQDYESGLEPLTHVLPRDIETPGTELAAATGVPRRGASLDFLYVWQRLQHTLAVRTVATDFLLEDALQRAPLDGKFLKLVNQTCLMLRVPWQIFVARALGSEPSADWNEWRSSAAAKRSAFASLMYEFRKWRDRQEAKLAGTIAREGRYTDAGRRWNRQQQQRNASFWARQQRAASSIIELEAQWLAAMSAMGQAARAQREAVVRESAELDAAAERLLEKLRTDTPSQDLGPPSFEVPVLDLDQRMAQWRDAVRAAASELLPAEIETCTPAALPAWWRRWPALRPRTILEGSVSHAGLPRIRAALEPWTTRNQSLLRDIVRSIDTVEYARESVRNDPSAPEGLFQEAVSNAVTLLESRQMMGPEAAGDMDEGVAGGLIATIVDATVNFEFHWAGVTSQASRNRRAYYSVTARQMLGRSARVTSGRLVEQALRANQALLEHLGLRMPERPPVEAVTTRPQLSDALPVRLDKSLPAIYRHLFALAPVQDARFLIGRQAELDGLRQALDRWHAGLYSAVLLVGGRGSGKTSLLNCARVSFPSDVEVVMAEFNKRLRTATQLDEFIGPLIDGGPGRRKVIIVEEFERVYLKHAGGFGALRRLAQVLAQTAKDILWVFSINDAAMRFLNFGAEMGTFFPVRIDAMSVRKTDLRNAILQRHNLSGLRLRFERPPSARPRLDRARRWLGLTDDPETLFFESLYHESGGVFRSAFELWLASIQRVDGGYVEMRQPLAPDYSRLWQTLTQADHFTLAAIMQHGSLLPEELSEVLLELETKSALRLRRLETMDLLEPDPRFPGLRILPGASRFVRETLHRVNLL
ncbi:MAG: ATP-binding protein [Bryobacterales bacterium]|nr:ATP-binding protein [Bryobacterales bacterium]